MLISKQKKDPALCYQEILTELQNVQSLILSLLLLHSHCCYINFKKLLSSARRFYILLVNIYIRIYILLVNICERILCHFLSLMYMYMEGECKAMYME